MTKHLVTGYQPFWFVQQDKGRISLKLDGVKKVCPIMTSSGAEFLAMLTILQGQKRVVFDTNTKVLSTSW